MAFRPGRGRSADFYFAGKQKGDLIYGLQQRGYHSNGERGGCKIHPNAVHRHLWPAEKRGHHRLPDREGRGQPDHDRRLLHRGVCPHQRVGPVSLARPGQLCHLPLAAPARQGGPAHLRRAQPGRHSLCGRPPGGAGAGAGESEGHGLRHLQRGPRGGVLPVPDR